MPQQYRIWCTDVDSPGMVSRGQRLPKDGDLNLPNIAIEHVEWWACYNFYMFGSKCRDVLEMWWVLVKWKGIPISNYIVKKMYHNYDLKWLQKHNNNLQRDNFLSSSYSMATVQLHWVYCHVLSSMNGSISKHKSPWFKINDQISQSTLPVN